jgi:hypothetical protein
MNQDLRFIKSQINVSNGCRLPEGVHWADCPSCYIYRGGNMARNLLINDPLEGLWGTHSKSIHSFVFRLPDGKFVAIHPSSGNRWKNPESRQEVKDHLGAFKRRRTAEEFERYLERQITEPWTEGFVMKYDDKTYLFGRIDSTRTCIINATDLKLAHIHTEPNTSRSTKTINREMWDEFQDIYI